MDQLKEESETAGRMYLFDHLKVYLTGERGSVSYKSVGVRLDMTEGAVKAAVHRLRQRYRELVRQEIRHTVASQEQLEEEVRDLFTALAG